MRSFTRTGLGAVTAATMATGTFPVIVASVLAAQLIEEFDITRAQVGVLVTATGLVGGLAAPLSGRVTDRIGAVNATRGVLIAGLVTLAALALSPSYAFLVVAALATGIPNGWCNPATNALIVDNLEVGQRGLVTGIKQSGVQVGTFLGGLLLPFFAALWDWRVALLIFLVMPVGGLVGMWGRLGRHAPHPAAELGKGRVPNSVRWIAVYGGVSGLATSAMFGFLPLFAKEDQLWSAQGAGNLVAIVGLTGVAARILWPPAAESRLGHGRTLSALGLISAVSAVLLALVAVGILDGWVMVPAALLFGAGSISWNAVGMLAVMDLSPREMVGKGTGLVLLGFLLGLAAGAPLLGLSVDATGTYVPGWFGVALLHGLTMLLAARIPSGSTLARS